MLDRIKFKKLNKKKSSAQIKTWKCFSMKFCNLLHHSSNVNIHFHLLLGNRNQTNFKSDLVFVGILQWSSRLSWLTECVCSQRWNSYFFCLKNIMSFHDEFEFTKSHERQRERTRVDQFKVTPVLVHIQILLIYCVLLHVISCVWQIRLQPKWVTNVRFNYKRKK